MSDLHALVLRVLLALGGTLACLGVLVPLVFWVHYRPLGDRDRRNSAACFVLGVVVLALWAILR